MKKAYTCEIDRIFTDRARYVVPPFQRNYVWTGAKWDLLWQDILACAARPDRGNHFLGAIVLQDDDTVEIGQPKSTFVVDGQQRLTTIQILIAAIRSAAEQAGQASLVERTQDLMYIDRDVNQPKLVTALADAEGFAMVIGGAVAATRSSDEPTHVQAYRRFSRCIRDWLATQPDPADALTRLLDIVTKHLYVVVADLHDYDDPQAIYERLNSGGEPLRASELIRNHILHRCRRQGIPVAEAYDQYWESLDDGAWYARAPGSTEADIDVFLRSYLILATRTEVPERQLFPPFRDYVAAHEDDLRGLLARIVESAALFRRIRTGTGLLPHERRFADRMRASGIYAFMPVVMHLFSTYSAEQRRPALDALESYVLRRVICSRPSKNYPDMVVPLLRALTPDADPGPVVYEYLSEPRRGWPTDAAVKTAIETWNAYGRRRLAKELLLLAEQQYSGRHAEPITFALPDLSVEHLMPQGWREAEWPVEADTEEQAVRERIARNRLIPTLGNLTVITPDLNGFMGNRAWAEKYPALTKNSRLRINQALPETFACAADIRRRGAFLADLIVAALMSPPEAGRTTTSGDGAGSGSPVGLLGEPAPGGPEGGARATGSDASAAGDLLDDTDSDDAEPEDPETDTDTDAEADGDTDTDADTDADAENGTRADAPGAAPAGFAAQIRAALAAAGRPLTYIELAEATGLPRARIRRRLQQRTVSGVSPTIKNGMIAAKLKPRRPTA